MDIMDIEERLSKYCKKGDIDKIKTEIENINTNIDYFYSKLFEYACRYNFLDLLKYLFEHCIKYNKIITDRNVYINVFDLICCHSEKKIIKCLIEYSEKINKRIDIDSSRLHFTMVLNVIDVLEYLIYLVHHNYRTNICDYAGSIYINKLNTFIICKHVITCENICIINNNRILLNNTNKVYITNLNYNLYINYIINQVC